MNPREYREALQAEARGLRSEGLSQTAIAKELGVAQQRISDWLSTNGAHPIAPPCGTDLVSTGTRLANTTAARYLVINERIEDFTPPKGLRFPLILADPPWNISDEGHKRGQEALPSASA